MIEWLIDSLLSAWPIIIFYWCGLYIFRKVFKDSFKWSSKFFIITTLLLFLASAFNSANRPKFDRVPDQTVKQMSYESEIEYKASKEVEKAVSIQEQHKDLVEETKKKFEY